MALTQQYILGGRPAPAFIQVEDRPSWAGVAEQWGIYEAWPKDEDEVRMIAVSRTDTRDADEIIRATFGDGAERYAEATWMCQDVLGGGVWLRYDRMAQIKSDPMLIEVRSIWLSYAEYALSFPRAQLMAEGKRRADCVMAIGVGQPPAEVLDVRLRDKDLGGVDSDRHWRRPVSYAYPRHRIATEDILKAVCIKKKAIR